MNLLQIFFILSQLFHDVLLEMLLSKEHTLSNSAPIENVLPEKLLEASCYSLFLGSVLVLHVCASDHGSNELTPVEPCIVICVRVHVSFSDIFRLELLVKQLNTVAKIDVLLHFNVLHVSGLRLKD